MDAKYLGVTLSNGLESSKHIATMTNKFNSKLLFFALQPEGKIAYFSLIHIFYGVWHHWNPYQKYNSDKVERVQCRAARFVKCRYTV